MSAVLFVIENFLGFAALFAGIWLIKKLFHKQMSAQMHFLIWGVAVIKLLIPVGFPSAISPWNWLDSPAAPVMVQGGNETYGHSAAKSGPAYEDPAYNSADNFVSDGEHTQQPADESSAAGPVSRPLDQMDWNTVIAAVWLSGVAARLARLGLKNRGFRKKLLIEEISPPEWAGECFRSCLRETGVKKEVRLVVQDAFPVPMVAGYVKPVLILPQKLLQDRDAERLRHVLVHETAHIVRKDTLAVPLLNVLSAVYWFNPLVWLCFRLIRKDMETACDCAVIRALGKDKRQDYIETVMRFAGRKESPPLRTAMGINDGHGSMERRIRGMFMRTRTKARVKVPAAILACILAFACFTTACQPTPEIPPMAYKNTDLVKTVLDAGGDEAELKKQKQAIREQVESLGGHLKEAFSPGGRVTIDVDADIIPPGLDPLPLVRLKPVNFSREQFETFMDYIRDGQPLYHVHIETDEHGDRVDRVFTKEELVVMLTHIREYLADGDLPEDKKSDWDVIIPILENDYATAIGKAGEKPYDGTLTDMEQSSAIWLKCYMGRDRAAWFRLFQYPDGNGSQITFDNSDYGFGCYNTFTPYQGADAERIDMTYEEAKASAEEFVRTIDGEDSNLVLCESGVGCEIGTLANYTEETSPQAYTFTFARSYEGAAVKPVDFMRGNSAVIGYSRRVFPEELFVVIDNEGIRKADWLNHTEPFETVSKDMPLLDFKTIRQIFERHCAHEFSWVPGDDGYPSDIRITFIVKKIEFNMMVVPEKENPGVCITVPVWDFIGDMEYDREFDLNGNRIEGQKDASILTINAIDGTIINREQGY